MADFNLGVGGITSNDAGTRKLLHIEAELLRQFSSFADTHGSPPCGKDREYRSIGVGRNRGARHVVRLTPR
jgi:hypothetical protein